MPVIHANMSRASECSCDDEQVAIKFIPRGEKITKYVEREIVNHSHLLHPVSNGSLACLWQAANSSMFVDHGMGSMQHIIKFEEVFLTSNHLAIGEEAWRYDAC